MPRRVLVGALLAAPIERSSIVLNHNACGHGRGKQRPYKRGRAHR